MSRSQRTAQRPEELKFTEEDIGFTGSSPNLSWRVRHARLIAGLSLLALPVGAAGGGFLGYRTGEKVARSEAKYHADRAAWLQGCITELEPYTSNQEAHFRYSSLPDEVQFACEVVALPDEVKELTSLSSTSNVEVGQPQFDAPLTFNAGGMIAEKASEERKSREDRDSYGHIGAAAGAFLGFSLGAVAVNVINDPGLVRRSLRPFRQFLGGAVYDEPEKDQPLPENAGTPQ